MDKDKKAILNLILGIERSTNRKSTLQLALIQARKLVGKKEGEIITPPKPKKQEQFEEHNSEIKQNDNLHNLSEVEVNEVIKDYSDQDNEEVMKIFTSLCLYLIVLDQLGHIYRSQGDNGSNMIEQAIKKSEAYNKLSPQNAERTSVSIANLRNSINHNFGLANYNPFRNKGNRNYKFTICITEDDGIQQPIKLPIQDWDGDWKDKSDTTSTVVYPFSLMNYIEEVLSSYIEMHKKEAIESRLGIEELKTRFTIVTNF